jgi:integrase
MNANGFKRCKCRDGAGRELGAKCPKLRRANGSWNPNHGTWYGKAELPPGPDGKRVYLRMGGFQSEGDLKDAYEAAERLLDIPDAGHEGHQARMEIRAMVMAAHAKTAPLPDVDELRRKYQAGQPLQSMLFGDYFAQWVKRRRQAGDIRKSTLMGYESHYRVHLAEVLAGVRMDRLWVVVVEAVFVRIDEKNEAVLKARASDDPQIRASVKGQRITGAATKQRVRATLRTVLSDAHREGLVGANVAKLVKLDPGKRPKAIVWTRVRTEAFMAAYNKKLEAARAAGGRTVNALKVWQSLPVALRPSPVMVWTPRQLGVFLDYAVRHRLYALFHLIAFRGLRRGEACGVRWVDVDFDEGTLTVAKQLVQLGWDVEEGDPKTEASDATIAIDKVTASVLKVHRAQQNAERLAWGESWVKTGRIFTKEDGSELHPAWVSELFERLAFDAGLPPIRLHDLRHVAATIAYAAGGDTKIVSAMLRHSGTAITTDTYTSILPELAHEAAEASAALVPRMVVVGESSETDGLPSVSQVGDRAPTDFRGRKKMLVRRSPSGGAPGIRTLNLRIKRELGNVPDGDE